jgi:rhomboid family GlyGly-CTERM serine protease
VPEAGSLAFDRDAILAGEAWRLWSGHLVHFSRQQLGLDVGTLVLAGTLAERQFGTRATAWVLALAMPVLSLGLLVLVPGLAEYRGASGVAILLALWGGTGVWYRSPHLRSVLGALGLGLLTKIVLDAAGLLPRTVVLPEGVVVAWQAHLLGAFIGLACAFWQLRLMRRL